MPVILGSDKTTVSVATGQNDYYPLYASIGNVHNNVRRAHRNAVAVVGFLAIPKSSFLIIPVFSRLTTFDHSNETTCRRSTLPEIQETTFPFVTIKNIVIT